MRQNCAFFGVFPPRSTSNLVLIIVLFCDKTTAKMEQLRGRHAQTHDKNMDRKFPWQAKVLAPMKNSFVLQ